MGHSERKHALLSASGAARWLNCTPSPKLEELVPEKTSIFAEEGTLAHEFAELELKVQALGSLTKRKYNSQLKKLRAHKLYTNDMETHVEKYVNCVIEEYNTLRRENKGCTIAIEEKVDLGQYIKEGFGTCDNIIVADGILKVIDLKYGQGVKVFADDNAQLKLYGLGALSVYDMLYDIKEVELVIVQPRIDHISTWKISVQALRDWGEFTVKHQAFLAYEGKGEQKAGDWCRWCKVAGMCKKFASYNLEIAKHEFAEPFLLSDAELLEVYNKIPAFKMWIEAVYEHVYLEAMAGKKWEGLKLVEGKSNRKWLDESGVAKVLMSNNFDPEQFMVSKLGGIGFIEKLVGKDNFYPMLSEHIIKPPGKPTLVPESDKRPAIGIEQAKLDFN